MTELRITYVDGRWQVQEYPDGRTPRNVGPKWPERRDAEAFYDRLQTQPYVSPLRSSAGESDVPSSDSPADARSVSSAWG